MTKTYCNKCIFSDTISSGSPCGFDITNILQQGGRQLSDVDNYYVINDYHCLYGFGKSQYEQYTKEFNDIDLTSMIAEKAALKYYLLIDARDVQDDLIPDLIEKINGLNISPKKISIIIGPDRSEEIYHIIKNNISCSKWTVHVFLYSLSFNDCINIVLDTNLSNSGAWCVLFYDGTKYKNNKNSILDLSSIIDYLHIKIIIEQKTNFGCQLSLDSLHGLCLNASVFKYLTSVISNNILDGLRVKSDIHLLSYDS